jgi:hypothetical protein
MNKLAIGMLLALGVSAAAVAQQPSQRTPSPEPRVAPPADTQPEPRRGRGADSPSVPSEPRQGATTFAGADRDGDGVISRAEASTIPGLDFSAADRDKNASIDKREFEIAMAETSRPRG